MFKIKTLVAIVLFITGSTLFAATSPITLSVNANSVPGTASNFTFNYGNSSSTTGTAMLTYGGTYKMRFAPGSGILSSPTNVTVIPVGPIWFFKNPSSVTSPSYANSDNTNPGQTTSVNLLMVAGRDDSILESLGRMSFTSSTLGISATGVVNPAVANGILTLTSVYNMSGSSIGTSTYDIFSGSLTNGYATLKTQTYTGVQLFSKGSMQLSTDGVGIVSDNKSRQGQYLALPVESAANFFTNNASNAFEGTVELATAHTTLSQIDAVAIPTNATTIPVYTSQYDNPLSQVLLFTLNIVATNSPSTGFVTATISKSGYSDTSAQCMASTTYAALICVGQYWANSSKAIFMKFKAPVNSFRAMAAIVSPNSIYMTANGDLDFTIKNFSSRAISLSQSGLAAGFTGSLDGLAGRCSTTLRPFSTCIYRVTANLADRSNGTTTSTLTYDGAYTLTATIKYAIGLLSVAVTPANASKTVANTLSYTATGTFAGGTNALTNCTWASSDATKATISAGGLGTPVAAGSANISATCGSVSGSTGLTVMNAPPQVGGTPTATPGNTTCAVSWSAAGGSTTAYLITVGRGSGEGDVLRDSNIGNVTSYTVSSLTNGTTYYISVKSTNGDTNSVESREVTCVPAARGGGPIR